MIRSLVFAGLSAIAVSSCTTLNILKGPEDYNRNYLADDLICSIDTEVVAERDKKLPSGWLTKPYSPDLWQTYWTDRVVTFLNGEDFAQSFKGYRGPTSRTLALYILQQRRELDFPDLLPEPHVTELYAELDHNRTSSCARLGRPSPVCHLGAARYPGSPAFQRECHGN